MVEWVIWFLRIAFEKLVSDRTKAGCGLLKYLHHEETCKPEASRIAR